MICGRSYAPKFERHAFITSKERRASLASLTRCIQEHDFREELNLLRKGEQVTKTIRLSKFYPFIDEDDGIYVSADAFTHGLTLCLNRHCILLS